LSAATKKTRNLKERRQGLSRKRMEGVSEENYGAKKKKRNV